MDQFARHPSSWPSTWKAEVEALREYVKTLKRDRVTLLRLLHQHADPFNMPQENVAAWDEIQKKDINDAN